MNNIKLFIASCSMVFLILAIWVNSYYYSCFMLIFATIFLVLISYSFIDLKIQERKCFINCYFISSSIFAKIFSSKFLVIIIYFIASILMTISALYIVIDFSLIIWLYLILHIALCTFIYKYLYKKLATTIRPSYLGLFAREWTINITSLIIIIVYVYTMINGFEPNYLRDSLDETWRVASSSISSRCEIINYFLKLQIELESIFWWIMDKGTENVKDKTLKIGVWIIFLLMNSFAILGVNRFIAQIIYLIDKIFNRSHT